MSCSFEVGDYTVIGKELLSAINNNELLNMICWNKKNKKDCVLTTLDTNFSSDLTCRKRVKDKVLFVSRNSAVMRYFSKIKSLSSELLVPFRASTLPRMTKDT